MVVTRYTERRGGEHSEDNLCINSQEDVRHLVLLQHEDRGRVIRGEAVGRERALRGPGCSTQKSMKNIWWSQKREILEVASAEL